MKRHADETVIIDESATKVARVDARPLTRPTTGILIHPHERVEVITAAAELDPDVDVAVEPEYEYVLTPAALEPHLGKNNQEYNDGPFGWQDYWVFLSDQSRAYRHRCPCHIRRRNLLAQAVVERLGGDAWGAKDDWEGPAAIFGRDGASLTNEEIKKIQELAKTSLHPIDGWMPSHSSSSSSSSQSESSESEDSSNDE